MLFMILGLKEIIYELLFLKVPFSYKKKRLLFRLQFVRRYIRKVIDRQNSLIKTDSRYSDLVLNGYTTLKLKLNNTLVSKIKLMRYEEGQTKKIYNGVSSIDNSAFSNYGRYVCLDLETIENELYQLATQGEMFEYVKSYLGENASVDSFVSWVTTPSLLPDNHFEFGFHMDMGDTGGWKWLNAFIYLDDVGADQGPHRAVTGTHEKRHFSSFLERRMSEDRIHKIYGAERVVVFEGKAGTVVLEDTGNYHAASKVKSGKRHVLQIIYRANYHMAGFEQ